MDDMLCFVMVPVESATHSLSVQRAHPVNAGPDACVHVFKL